MTLPPQADAVGAHTPGPWFAGSDDQVPEHGWVYVHAAGRFDASEVIAEAYKTDADVDDGTLVETEANAHLIAEAGTVATETGLTPRQLAERVAELTKQRDELLDLALEVRGCWTAFEYALRQDIGNTNYALIRDKLDKLAPLLSRIGAGTP